MLTKIKPHVSLNAGSIKKTPDGEARLLQWAGRGYQPDALFPQGKIFEVEIHESDWNERFWFIHSGHIYGIAHADYQSIA